MFCCGGGKKSSTTPQKFDQQVEIAKKNSREEEIARKQSKESSTKVSSSSEENANMESPSRQKRGANAADSVLQKDIEKYVVPVHEKPESIQRKLKEMLVNCNTLRNLMGGNEEKHLETTTVSGVVGGKLVLNIARASGLRPADWTAESNPYIKIKVFCPEGTWDFKTRVQPNTLKPEWNQQIVADIEYKMYGEPTKVQFLAFDKENEIDEKNIGMYEMKYPTEQADYSEKEVSLTTTTAAGYASSTGKLKFGFSFDQVTGHDQAPSSLDDDKVMNQLVMALYPMVLEDKQELIRQGDEGREVYLIEDGEFRVTMNTKVHGEREIRTITEGTVGEVALALNITRTATVTAIKRSKVWVLDREVFNMVRMKNELNTKSQYQKFLKDVDIFGKLAAQEVLMLADAFIPENFADREEIVRQGDDGHKFYVLKSGVCEAVINGTDGEKVVRTYQRPGEYFGEIALLVADAKRSATVRANGPCFVLSITKAQFDRIIGADVRGILFENRDKYPKYADFKAGDVKETVVDTDKQVDELGFAGSTKVTKVTLRMYEKGLDEFEGFGRKNPGDPISMVDNSKVVRIGKGGFGAVIRANFKDWSENIPMVNGKKEKTVALKVLRKDRMRKVKDVRHVLDERNIMAQINHGMVVKLFGTFQDDSRLFFVMEYVEGGDLFSLIRKKQSLPSDVANLISAELVLVMGYFHDHGIIYRDLKPENVLVEKDTGHIKVIDFGFAIKLNPGQRAWTQCGTPCYMAPELVLGKGYQTSVDWWALGVLTFEMLMGNSPFDHQDPMTTLKKIIAFNTEDIKINHDLGAQDFVKQLLNRNHNNRLGCSKADWVDVSKHGLAKKKYKAPTSGFPQPSALKLATQEDIAEGKYAGAIPAGDAQKLFTPFTESLTDTITSGPIVL